MKKFSLTIFLAMLGILSLPLSSFAEQRINALSVSDSGCHHNTRSDSPYDEDYDANAWNLEYTDGILSVTWVNFVANCCPDGFNGWFELENDNHLIYNLHSNDDLCSCICVFDVTTTFGEIAPGHYTITFRSYEDIFAAEVDIEEGCSLCLKKAPAGIHSLTPESDTMSLSPDGILHVETSGKLVVEIFDASGVIQAHINADNKADIDITSLRKGIYFAKLNAGEKASTLRFAR